ncbi:hypothetical protein I549_4309 [Mycobacterium avium subsp. avium 2285 (R)]|nr:hypothetical protein I549_4309 [Mycobacterium avium subsp. avium 2285 (R)]
MHPNRFELGADEPGRNGHFRAVSRPRRPLTISTHLARVELPPNMSDFADDDGSITFGGVDWWFVVGAARTFARTRINEDVPAPFGFKLDGKWRWWDNTTTDESILDGPDASQHVRHYLAELFPGLAVTLTEP